MRIITAKEDNSAEILSIAEIKAHCRIDHDDDNALLSIYRSAAVTLIEQATDSDITPTVYEESYSGFYRSHHLTALPIDALSEVSYSDINNVKQIIASSNYTWYFPDSARGVVTFKDAYVFPTTFNKPDAVVIKYTVGVGIVSSLIKAAILLQIGSFYEHRENETELNLKTIAIGVQRIIDLYREMKY